MFRLRIPGLDETRADAVSDALMSAVDPATTAAGLVETESGWAAEAYYADAPDISRLQGLLARTLGREAETLRLDVAVLADRDWVRESLASLPPVPAGRFTVFGRHDRHRVPVNAVGIEIEAGQAFGTGHHATTLGCLTVIDQLLKRRRFRRPLDLGTGSGILAIGLAKVLRRTVVATDIDPLAARIAHENAIANSVGPLVRVYAADGVKAAAIRRGGPYDLVVANILAGPLVAIAPGVAGLASPAATVVLSGLLAWQQRYVEAAWRRFGFRLEYRLVIDNWATLTLSRVRRDTSGLSAHGSARS